MTGEIIIKKKKKKRICNLYLGFADLKKAFDCVPMEFAWLALRKLVVEEWLVKVVQSMYWRLEKEYWSQNDRE